MCVLLHVHIHVVSVCLFASLYASLYVCARSCARSCAHSRGVYICASCVYALMHHVRKQYMKKKIYIYIFKKTTMHHVDVHSVRCTYPKYTYMHA
jgi:hypothetical protein